MADDIDVTAWLQRLEAQPAESAQALWRQYYERLVRLAQRELRGRERRVVDEEDVALSAFHSFWQGAQKGRFPQLNDRNDLWKLLVVITSRKAGRQVAAARRVKRGGGKVRGDSVALDRDGEYGELEAFGRHQITPDFACELAEEFRRRMEQLTEPGWRDVALLKMEGWSNEEIAARLECSLRTIERRLNAIREIWMR